MCPNSHTGPCRTCDPMPSEPSDEPDEYSSPVLLDEPPDDVYLMGHFDGN